MSRKQRRFDGDVKGFDGIYIVVSDPIPLGPFTAALAYIDNLNIKHDDFSMARVSIAREGIQSWDGGAIGYHMI